jgi:hypothetical protein
LVRDVPVAQLDQSAGFLNRWSQVRVLPGTPDFNTPGNPGDHRPIGELKQHLQANRVRWLQ